MNTGTKLSLIAAMSGMNPYGPPLPKSRRGCTHCVECDAEIPPGRSGRKCKACRAKPAPIECVSCYEDFEQRADAPALRVCCKCEPDAAKMSDTRCPRCGWDSQSIECDESAPVEIFGRTSDFEFGYLGGEHWKERWTCPDCSTVFEFSNSSV